MTFFSDWLTNSGGNEQISGVSAIDALSELLPYLTSDEMSSLIDEVDRRSDYSSALRMLVPPQYVIGAEHVIGIRKAVVPQQGLSMVIEYLGCQRHPQAAATGQFATTAIIGTPPFRERVHDYAAANNSVCWDLAPAACNIVAVKGAKRRVLATMTLQSQMAVVRAEMVNSALMPPLEVLNASINIVTTSVTRQFELTGGRTTLFVAFICGECAGAITQGRCRWCRKSYGNLNMVDAEESLVTTIPGRVLSAIRYGTRYEWAINPIRAIKSEYAAWAMSGSTHMSSDRIQKTNRVIEV